MDSTLGGLYPQDHWLQICMGPSPAMNEGLHGLCKFLPRSPDPNFLAVKIVYAKQTKPGRADRRSHLRAQRSGPKTWRPVGMSPRPRRVRIPWIPMAARKSRTPQQGNSLACRLPNSFPVCSAGRCQASSLPPWRLPLSWLGEPSLFSWRKVSEFAARNRQSMTILTSSRNAIGICRRPHCDCASRQADRCRRVIPLADTARPPVSGSFANKPNIVEWHVHAASSRLITILAFWSLPGTMKAISIWVGHALPHQTSKPSR